MTSFLVHWTNHTPKERLVGLLIDRLALCLSSKSVINITLTFHFDWFTFFGLGDVRTNHWMIWHLAFCSHAKVHLSLTVMNLRSQFGSVWRRSMIPTCLNPFDYHSVVMALILCWLSACSNYSVIIIRIHFFHAQLICDHLNNRPSITTSPVFIPSMVTSVLLIKASRSWS